MTAPRWTRALLRLLAPSDRIEEVLGDLEEAHRTRVHQRGRGIGTLLTAAEALDMAFALARQRAAGLSRFSPLDFKLGFRMLVRHPGLTVVGGLSMAFAIAIGAAAFEAINQVLSPTLPFPDGDRIVGLRNWDAALSRAQARASRDLVAWRASLESVRDLGGFRRVERNLITEEGESAPILVTEISASAFAITGVTPVLGRPLVEADERPGAPSVLVIGEDAWISRFGRDPDVIGRSVRLDAAPMTIVGVLPSDFRFPIGQSAWTPLPWDLARRGWGEGPAIGVFGRLAPGVTLDAARAELSALGERMAAALPATHEHLVPDIRPFTEMNLPVLCGGGSLALCFTALRAGLYSGNVFFVAFLALICANVALLMFARAATRENEIIVRTALGASRGRITMQLVAEALALGSVAALVGLWAASLALRIARGLLDHLGEIPFWWEARLSVPSIAYALGLTLLGATIAGLVPALKITTRRRVPLATTTAGAGGLRFGRGWTAVIVGQVALTVFAVAMTTYVVQLTARIASYDLGIPGHEYLSVRLERDDEISARLVRELERRLTAEPQVRGVTFASRLPGSYHGRVRVEVDGVTGTHFVQPAWVDPGFFETFGAHAVAGRLLRPADVEPEEQVVVVNEELVRRIFGGRGAVGRHVRFQASEDPANLWGPWHEIVGVTRQLAMGTDPEMSPAGVYRPLPRGGTASTYMAVHLRGEPRAFAPGLRRITAAIDPSLRLDQPRTLIEARDAEAGWYRVWVRILLGACLLVLALSLAGIYSITSFTVSRRTREIGIRIALGGHRWRIVLPIFARPLRQVGLGVSVGVGSLVLLLLVDGGGLSWTMAAVALAFAIVMFGICMLACVVPTRRALGIEPTEALKIEG